jgi:hypothetical protein
MNRIWSIFVNVKKFLPVDCVQLTIFCLHWTLATVKVAHCRRLLTGLSMEIVTIRVILSCYQFTTNIASLNANENVMIINILTI